MTEYLISLAKYNLWANQTLVSWIDQIDYNQWSQSLISSFPSIKDTLAHIVGAEKIWLDRFNNIENSIWYPNVFSGDKQETTQDLIAASNRLVLFLEICTEENLSQFITYKRLNGEKNSHPLCHLVGHVINHSSYHRGQLVTLLRQVNFTNLSSLDYLIYLNIKN